MPGLNFTDPAKRTATPAAPFSARGWSATALRGATAYTAARLAAALGVTPQAVRSRLAGVRAPAEVEVNGLPALAWPLENLPPSLAADLAAALARAEAAGIRYRNLAHFLADPPTIPPGRALAKADPPAVPSGQWGALAPVLDNLSPCPSAVGIGYVRHVALREYESAMAAGRPRKATQRNLLTFLAPWPDVFGKLKNLRRWLCRWQKQGRTPEAATDHRAAANARRRVALPAQDRRQLAAAALQHGGDVRPAAVAVLNKLAPETRQRLAGSLKPGASVPRVIMREVGADVAALFDLHHRPKWAKANGASAQRDWSNVGAGDWFSADDFTLEIYFAAPDGRLTRGQFIPLLDLRSCYILDFVLVPERGYTGAHIRSLMNHAMRRYGVPRRGFFFESGIWKKSWLVGGAVPEAEFCSTLSQRLGIEIRHATPGNARAKPIEGQGRIFQSLLRDVPGWVGRNEQVFKVESVQRAKLDVEAGRKTAAEAGFLSFEEWHRLLEERCQAFNAREQRSRIMGGRTPVLMTPADAWKKLQPRNAGGEVEPLARLPEDCTWLFCSEQRRAKITARGLRVNGVYYVGKATGQHCGEQVTVFYDPAADCVHFKTDAGEIRTVPQAAELPAMDAQPDVLGRRTATVGAHNKALSARLSELKPAYLPPARRTLVDPATAAQGRVMREQSEQEQAAQREARFRQRRIQSVSQNLGGYPLDDSRPGSDVEALELLSARRQLDSQ